MIVVAEFEDEHGRSPFATWFNRLSPQAAAKVNTAVERLRRGNLSTTKGVGSGVLECRIDWGPGYRVYYAKDGMDFILLLGGGTKQRQQADIDSAKVRWAEYQRRKKGK